MKRAVVLLGSGASIDYGAPSTSRLTDIIRRQVSADAWMRRTGGDWVYSKIRDGLQGYFQHPDTVNFEHVYHCAHELIYASPPAAGAVDEFCPLLVPFINETLGATPGALSALADKIVEIIYTEVSNCCAAPVVSLTPLADLIAMQRRNFITRIYSTNYDDFPLQAVPDLYTGFDRAAPSPKRFELAQFWSAERTASFFQLHGSVHMGFGAPPQADLSELVWFDTREEARLHSKFVGGDARRMDGTGILRTSIITGLDKLSRLQQRPLSHFYSALARDAMLCDVIYMIGCGLNDLHLNNWMHEARSRRPRPPILFVDLWEDGFANVVGLVEAKLLRIFHSLKIEINRDFPGYSPAPGWTVSHDRTAAVWDSGFQEFLDAPDALLEVLHELGIHP
jgi:SIR2-like domain